VFVRGRMGSECTLCSLRAVYKGVADPLASELLDEYKVPTDIYRLQWSVCCRDHLSAEPQLAFQLRRLAHLCTMLLPDGRPCAVQLLQWLDALVHNWDAAEVPVNWACSVHVSIEAHFCDHDCCLCKHLRSDYLIDLCISYSVRSHGGRWQTVVRVAM
jgi:hypothetical protein